MEFEIISGQEPIGLSESMSELTAAACALVERCIQSETPSNTRFMAKTIASFSRQFNMQFTIEASESSETTQVITWYQNGQPVSRGILETKLPPQIEKKLQSLSPEIQQAKREHGFLSAIYSTMLKPLQQQYPIGLRLAIQQHDMLPIIAEQTLIVQDRLQSAPPHPAPITPSQAAYEQGEITKQKDKIAERAEEAFNQPTSSRTIDEETLSTLATLKVLATWTSAKYLGNVSALAIDSVANDHWKQARIQNATFWGNFDHIFQDGVISQFDIIVNLLIYHAYVNRVKFTSLEDILCILTDAKFQMTLHTLLGGKNGTNTRLWTHGQVPIDFLAKSDIPQVTAAGVDYLKAELREHNDQVRPHEQDLWDKTNIAYQPQRRCPAAVRIARLRVEGPELSQPGDSTGRYIHHLQTLAAQHPDVFRMSEENGEYLLTMVTDPIRLLTDVFVQVIDNYKTDQNIQ